MPPRWLDLRLVAGVVLVLASVAIGARVVGSADATVGVVAADHDLAAGKVLTAADLRLARVQLPDGGRRVYLATLRDAVGKQLRRDVSAGELLAADAVSAAAAMTTLTVALPSGAAPELTAGERIEIWLSSPACAATVLLPDITVQHVGKDSAGSFGSGDDGQKVVISVPRALADRVASALVIDQVQLRAGILRGRQDASDPAAATSLPDISGCMPAGH